MSNASLPLLQGLGWLRIGRAEGEADPHLATRGSYISPDHYSLVADGDKGETLEIDRHTNNITLVGKSYKG